MRNTIKLLLTLPPLILASCSDSSDEGKLVPVTDEQEVVKVDKPKEDRKIKPINKPKQPKPVASKPKPALPKDKYTKILEEQIPYLNIKPLSEITKNWTDIPEKAYPKTITAKVPVSVDLIISGQKAGQATVSAGKPLKPLKYANGKLKVSMPSNAKMSTVIDASDTNFKALIQKRYDDFVADAKVDVDKRRAKAKKILIAKAKESASRPASSQSTFNASSALALASGRGSRISDSDPRLSAVKSSIKGGALPVSLSDVDAYFWNGSERVNGSAYETVNVEASKTTIFGTFKNEYKCLLKSGRVTGWVDPITGDKIK